MTYSKKKIYFIVGPTASGKTALSIELAKSRLPDGCNGFEIISADSRQIYRGFDLSTGKVTTEEMEGIPHHLLDIVDPGVYFSVVDFVNLATKKIEEIYKRGNIPIICGGTGFYIDSLIYEYNLPPVIKDEKLRKELENKTSDMLYIILKKTFKKAGFFSRINHFFANRQTLKKFADPEFKNNKHRIIRAIEIATQLGYVPQLKKTERYSEPEYDLKIISTNLSKDVLEKKIYKRLIDRIDQGMIKEIENAIEKYNLSYEYLDDLGLEFKWTAKFLKGEISKEEMIKGLGLEIFQYAKRQIAWFKRYKTATL
jgi:tRNA dimethylallyltransferase